MINIPHLFDKLAESAAVGHHAVYGGMLRIWTYIVVLRGLWPLLLLCYLLRLYISCVIE